MVRPIFPLKIPGDTTILRRKFTMEWPGMWYVGKSILAVSSTLFRLLCTCLNRKIFYGSRYYIIHDGRASATNGIHLDGGLHRSIICFSCASAFVCLEYLYFAIWGHCVGLYHFIGHYRCYNCLFNVRAARVQPQLLRDHFFRSNFAGQQYSKPNGNAFDAKNTVGTNFNGESVPSTLTLFFSLILIPLPASHWSNILVSVCIIDWIAIHLHIVHGQNCRYVTIDNKFNQNTRRFTPLRNEIWCSRYTIQSTLFPHNERIDSSRLISNENLTTKRIAQILQFDVWHRFVTKGKLSISLSSPSNMWLISYDFVGALCLFCWTWFGLRSHRWNILRKWKMRINWSSIFGYGQSMVFNQEALTTEGNAESEVSFWKNKKLQKLQNYTI